MRTRWCASREYSPPFDEERFAAHERFFVEDVRNWVRSRFGVAVPAGRTAVCGVSASGEFAIAMGLRHPDLYGSVFSASPGGGYRPPAVMPSPLPRFYFVAGTLRAVLPGERNPLGGRTARCGADVVRTERVGGHGDSFWRAELPLRRPGRPDTDACLRRLGSSAGSSATSRRGKISGSEAMSPDEKDSSARPRCSLQATTGNRRSRSASHITIFAALRDAVAVPPLPPTARHVPRTLLAQPVSDSPFTGAGLLLLPGDAAGDPARGAEPAANPA